MRGLAVDLPDGTPLLRNVDLTLRAGEVVAVLGPSGSGKTTALRAIVDPKELQKAGYAVRCEERIVAAEPSFVPQRGALFDHLDVRGNIELALAAAKRKDSVEDHLSSVELDASFAVAGRKVSELSGGQAQRVAVARTLAAGRRLLILDEPSVGLDPLGVRRLAQLIATRAREHGLAVLLITHDLSLAAGAATAITYLDPTTKTLLAVDAGHPGPLELRPEEERAAALAALEENITTRLADGRISTRPRPKPSRILSLKLAAPSAPVVLGSALRHAFSPRLFLPSLHVMTRAGRQSLLRPLPFYFIVGALLGFTVLYVIAKMSADVRADAMLRLVGGTYILSLAPPLSAILFAATSGNAVNAWLGGMQLGKQVQALDGLAVPKERYLWSPAWLALFLSYLLTFCIFVLAMVLGGYLLFVRYDVGNALTILTSDFFDPPPERSPYLVRGVWLVVTYAASIASIVVSRGMRPKEEAADVTGAMTSAVIASTLFVVSMELLSVIILFWTVGR